MKARTVLLIALLGAWGCAPGTGGGSKSAAQQAITFTPVKHATMVIAAGNTTIYVDPVGKAEAYAKFARPDIILITDIHGDHLDPALVKSLKTKETAVVGPQAVVDKLAFGTAISNGESRTVKGVSIRAVAMYNLTKERLKFHPKGRGNGYVLTLGGERVYISGDTEDVKEMRALKDIDYAFVCMNLPYTMTVERAASAVLEMKPKVAIPYHYRGRQGKKRVFSDVAKFKRLVGVNKKIEVRLLEWYD